MSNGGHTTVATVVDDVNQAFLLAQDKGEWDAALRTVRKALRKKGAETNSYLRRLAADCSLALGDWPSALKYARDASALTGGDHGSGSIRRCARRRMPSSAWVTSREHGTFARRRLTGPRVTRFRAII